MTQATAETTLGKLLEDGLFVDGDWIESKDQDPGGEVRLIQLADIGDGVFRNRSSRFLTMAKAKELDCTFLEPGDVLVARMPEPLGRACVFPGIDRPAVTAVDVCIVRPNPKRVESRWLAAIINAPKFRSSMQQFIRGTTRQRISRRNLGVLALPVVALSEQQATAAIVERLDYHRSAAIRHMASARTTIQELRRAIFQWACSGRLTDDWRAEDPTRADGADELLRQLESGPPRTARQAAVKEGIRGLPVQWREATGSVVFPFVTSGSRGWARYYSASGPLFLRVANLDHNSIDLDLSEVQHIAPPITAESKRAMVRTGDLLISITAEIGMVGVVPASLAESYVSQHVAIARPHPALNSRFLAVFIAASNGGVKQLESLQRGATKIGLGLDDIRSLVVPVPPAPEQAEIVRRVDLLLALTDSLEERVKHVDTGLGRASHAVLDKAFHGELALKVNGHRAEAVGRRARTA